MITRWCMIVATDYMMVTWWSHDDGMLVVGWLPDGYVMVTWWWQAGYSCMMEHDGYGTWWLWYYYDSIIDYYIILAGLQIMLWVGNCFYFDVAAGLALGQVGRSSNSRPLESAWLVRLEREGIFWLLVKDSVGMLCAIRRKSQLVTASQCTPCPCELKTRMQVHVCNGMHMGYVVWFFAW